MDVDQQSEDGAAPDRNVPPPPPVLPPPPVELPPNADPGTRELAFAAQRYAAAAASNSADYEAVYNHGLALQELATRSGANSPQQYQLLSQACQQYEAACALQHSSHAALYNWGVALSDLARHTRSADAAAAEQYLLLSAQKYQHSLKWNPNNPQALNNWGLVLQELSGLRPAAERAFLVAAATTKFRRAIRLRPEFDRACYNLGTVFYSYAVAQQSESDDRGSIASESSQGLRSGHAEEQQEDGARSCFQLAAQYITLAQALQPSKEVYRKSLQVLRQMLPLPQLRVGYLLAVDHALSPAIDERWQRCWFVLDAESLRTAPHPQRQPPGGQPAIELSIPLSDIQSAKAAADPSLPPGSAIWVQLFSRPQGLYFVSASKEDADGWLDAIYLCGHLATVGRLGPLRATLSGQPVHPRGSSTAG